MPAIKLSLVQWGGHFGEPLSKVHIWSSKSGWRGTGGTICGKTAGLRSGGARHFAGSVRQVTCKKCRSIHKGE